MNLSPFLILGIETSCDETGVAVVEGGRNILSSIVSSQARLHSRYGGVIPELASRKQIEVINPILEEAVGKAGVRPNDIDAIAVTSEPGLIGSLLVGTSTAGALCYAWNLPLVEVNHVEAHIYANYLRIPDKKKPPVLESPFIGLVVSGGHTSLFVVRGHGHMELLGRTRDDAAGEAFDKVGKLLGLLYPGGPQIERIARKGNPERIKFPRPYLHGSHDFSFSGLKTAVAYYLRDRMPATKAVGKQGKRQEKELVAKLTDKLKTDIAAGFQAAVVDVLVYKAINAARKRNIKRIALGGGVASNGELRTMLRREAGAKGIEVFIPPRNLCLDNAAMVACRAFYQCKHLIPGSKER